MIHSRTIATLRGHTPCWWFVVGKGTLMADDSDDMNPVTCGELRKELANYPTKSDLREELALTKAELREELKNYPTKSDLREALANYPTKSDLREELDQRFAENTQQIIHVMRRAFDEHEERMTARLTEQIQQSEQRMTAAIQQSELRTQAELAQHTASLESSFRTQISVVEEKHKDTPTRITSIENKQAEHEQRIQRLEAAVPPTPPRKRARRRGERCDLTNRPRQANSHHPPGV